MTDRSRPGAAPTPFGTALSGLCPRCGARTLFDDVVRFAPRCASCGLDYAALNVSDRPAAFLTLGLAAIIAGIAITLDRIVHPPLWLHVILWVPITMGAVILALRMAKGVMIASRYRRRARSGRPGGGAA